MIFAIMEQILTFAPLILGLYISYSLMDLTDLTVEGSYLIAASVYAVLISKGENSFISFLSGLASAGSLGCISAFIQERIRISALLTGIIISFIIVSFALLVMGRANISLIGIDKRISFTEVFCIVFMISSLIIFTLNTKIGILFRAFASNKTLLNNIGFSSLSTRVIGLTISNTSAGLSGILTCKINGYADIHMGFGVALITITAILLGTKIVSKLHRSYQYSLLKDCLGLTLGISLYFLILTLFIRTGLNPIFVKLLVGTLLLVILYFSRPRKILL